MTKPSNTTRRRFVQFIVNGVATAPFAGALLGGTAIAAEIVSETGAQAQALGYKADATKAANRKDAKAFCQTCNFFSGKPGAASGPCALFAGNLVNAKGWCSAWIKKQG